MFQDIAVQVPAMPLVYYNRQGKLTRYLEPILTPPPMIIVPQVQPEEVHRAAVPGIGRELLSFHIVTSFSFPQLVRCFRYKDLYDNVLFNYQVLKHSLLTFISTIPLSGSTTRCALSHFLR